MLHTDRMVTKSLEVSFTPADFAALKSRDLSATACVVFDVLRATSSMITALANGAECVFPVESIADALALRARHPAALLTGERDGVRILAAQTDGTDFDLGNSPREFTPEAVRGKTIILTTTNGSRALVACTGARLVLASSFLNLAATARVLQAASISNLIIVCAGTYEEAAFEDTLAAGALCELVWNQFQNGKIVDSAQMARDIYLTHRKELLASLTRSRNAVRLLSRPDLADDVPFSLQMNRHDFAAEMKDGAVRVRN